MIIMSIVKNTSTKEIHYISVKDAYESLHRICSGWIQDGIPFSYNVDGPNVELRSGKGTISFSDASLPTNQ
jgi:hypothetical protein